MAVAIVTGASSGIGLEIARMLVAQSYTVWGIARNFSNCDLEDENFIRTVCDLTDIPALESTTNRILSQSKSLDVLVNNAGVGYFGPHETLSTAHIIQMVQTNLTAPLVLSKLVLRHLQAGRGFIINIASTAALYPHRFGCAYAATKAGLLQFGESLFDEARKAGVKVCTVCPDMASGTNFFDNASFQNDESTDCHIDKVCVAEAVRAILSQRDGTVQTKIVLRPQRVGIAHKSR
jgi:hypothetical protein